MTALEDVVTTLRVDDIVDGADVLAEVEGDDRLAVVGLEVLARLVVAESCGTDCCDDGATAEVGGTRNSSACPGWNSMAVTVLTTETNGHGA